jgi:hypothetical protein
MKKRWVVFWVAFVMFSLGFYQFQHFLLNDYFAGNGSGCNYDYRITEFKTTDLPICLTIRENGCVSDFYITGNCSENITIENVVLPQKLARHIIYAGGKIHSKMSPETFINDSFVGCQIRNISLTGQVGSSVFSISYSKQPKVC